VGFSPCGPDTAAFNFDEAAQNFAYAGLSFPVVEGTPTDDEVEALLEPPHAARRQREATTIPVERTRIYFIPKNLPNLLRRPVRERGIPVAREILRFAAVTPMARFHENVRPGPSFMILTVPVGHAKMLGIVVVGGTPR
jgi:hypothetical protein